MTPKQLGKTPNLPEFGSRDYPHRFHQRLDKILRDVLLVFSSIYRTSEDIEIIDSSKGVILRSPNGTRWRVTVDDAGTLNTAAL